MKNNLNKLVNALYERNYFRDGNVSFTINYESLIKDFHRLKFDKNVEKIKKHIKDSKDINSFNLTISLTRGTQNHENYSRNWRTIDYTFYGGPNENNKEEEEENDTVNVFKYGAFSWKSLGKRGELDIEKELSRPDFKSDERFARIWGNYFGYDNVDKTLDALIELDELLDKQAEEKNLIFDKLKLEAKFKN